MVYDLTKQIELDFYIKQKRITTLIPELLKRYGIDLWIVASREYNEDPLFHQLTPMLEAHASRMSILLFQQDTQYSISGDGYGLYELYWDHGTENQWQALERFIREKRVKKVAINTSDDYPIADGLSSSLYHMLFPYLEDCEVLSSQELVCSFLETRTSEELKLYTLVYDTALSILKDSFSSHVIQPGTTTTKALELHLVEHTKKLGLINWFKPDVALQRKGETDARIFDQTIQYGDLIQIDFGLTYLGLCTDTQRLLYINRPGEPLPQGFSDGISRSNRFQTIVMEQATVGKTGNQILKDSLEQARKEGLSAKLYTHPIGTHGHGIGPSIGMWDQQVSVPVRGDLKLNDNTCYALELNTRSFIEQWNQEVVFFLEETVKVEDGKMQFILPHQEKINLLNA